MVFPRLGRHGCILGGLGDPKNGQKRQKWHVSKTRSTFEKNTILENIMIGSTSNFSKIWVFENLCKF